MDNIVIRVENLSKRYRIGVGRARYGSLRESLANVARAPFKKRDSGDQSEAIATGYIWALKGVNFEVQRGEVIGIIGRNGAGKSTLLKILARITKPTEGRVSLRGRVGSLLEVGTGFHPELTGRENIYLNGAVLGMRRSEIGRKFDEIVDFAEIAQFLDTPVKHYSSGMYMRLAFAVAAHLEPEILLVDEVLAVGDVEFQKKCLGKIGEVVQEGRTVLFVSHNMGTIESLCDQAILIQAGEIICKGPTQQIIRYYLEKTLSDHASVISLKERKDRSGNGRVRLTSFHVETRDGIQITSTQSGMDTVFVFGYECQQGIDAKHVDIGFSISLETGFMLCVLYSSYTGLIFEKIPPNGYFKCSVPKLPLYPGRYLVGARVTVAGVEADWPRDYVGFLNVDSGNYFGSGSAGFPGNVPFYVNGEWNVREV